MISQPQALDVVVRRARPEDTEAVAEIYNHGIETGISTFDSFCVDASRYATFLQNDGRCSLLVAVVGQTVVGWTSVSPISERWAYRFTCLGSTFVHRDYRHRGIGSALKAAQIREAAKLGYHSLIGEILSTNILSIAQHLRFGFKIVGEMAEVGYRNDKWIGLIVVQKMLGVQPMRERQIRFSVVTDDIERSIRFYRDKLGLRMRPICNAIAMFPLGTAEFEVCQRDVAKELLGIDFALRVTSGLLVSLAMDSESHLKAVLTAAIDSGATPLESLLPDRAGFRDFNGIDWLLEVVGTPVEAETK